MTAVLFGPNLFKHLFKLLFLQSVTDKTWLVTLYTHIS